jgi:exodeoxyribonuclease V beta subunit
MTHRLVEASAGTGKTTEIIRIVMGLLSSGAAVEEILLVTFTDKATGELRTRLRQELSRICAEHKGKDTSRYQTALHNLDRAAVFTIHGFCNQLLVQYAFELGQTLKTDLARDEELVFQLLAAEKRSWPAEFGSDLPEVLRAANYPSYSTYYKQSEWERDVLGVLARYQPGDVISTTTNEENFKAQGAFLKKRTIIRLAEAISKRKRERSLLTYGDMLVNVRDALRHGGPLLEQVRARYRHAIVDEFQDTDLIQWEIFRESFFESKAHTLTVVGDPKQAIYGFRGANVYTYQEAKRAIRSQFPAGPSDELDVCYRSTSHLIACLNQMFAHAEWFGKNYHPVKADCKKTTVLSEAEQKKPVVAVDFSSELKAPQVLYRFARFAAGEISSLLSSGIKPGAIAILVRSKKQALAFEAALRRAGIASRFYRKPGVYQSDEAMQWQAVLRAVASLSVRDVRAALLTSFFRAALEDVALGGDPPEEIMEKFRVWNSLALRRKWPEMFRSLLVETAAVFPDSGLSVPVSETDDFDARRVNLEQIAQDLESQAQKEKLNIAGILDLLRARRLEQVMVDENASLYRDENSDQSIRIMTMHVAKGLEFNIVFAIGSIGAGRPAPPFAYFSQENGAWVRRFDLDGSAPPEFLRQAQEEERRLWYVALTRAIERVYVPRFHAARGQRGAVQTILYPALMSVKTEVVKPEDQTLQKSVRKARLPKEDSDFSTNYFTSRPDFSHRARGLESYSSLKRNLARAEEASSFGDLENDPDRSADDSAAVTEEPAAVQKTDRRGNLMFLPPVETLPGGISAGLALHDILDGLDFALFASDSPPRFVDLPEAVRKKMEKSMSERRYSGPNFSRMILELIWNVANAEIPEAGRLTAVTEKLHEMAFFLKLAFPPDLILPPHISFRDGYLHGAIDLVFRAGGKYYLLDWKSDRLPSYDSASLASAMRESKYDLQSVIYAEAVKRYLRASVTGFKESDFGGSFYLFLRGMKAGQNAGIHFIAPDSQRMEEVLLNL